MSDWYYPDEADQLGTILAEAVTEAHDTTADRAEVEVGYGQVSVRLTWEADPDDA